VSSLTLTATNSGQRQRARQNVSFVLSSSEERQKDRGGIDRGWLNTFELEFFDRRQRSDASSQVCSIKARDDARKNIHRVVGAEH